MAFPFPYPCHPAQCLAKTQNWIGTPSQAGCLWGPSSHTSVESLCLLFEGIGDNTRSLDQQKQDWDNKEHDVALPRQYSSPQWVVPQHALLRSTEADGLAVLRSSSIIRSPLSPWKIALPWYRTSPRSAEPRCMWDAGQEQDWQVNLQTSSPVQVCTACRKRGSAAKVSYLPTVCSRQTYWHAQLVRNQLSHTHFSFLNMCTFPFI